LSVFGVDGFNLIVAIDGIDEFFVELGSHTHFLPQRV
jgi:hypothetical protein